MTSGRTLLFFIAAVCTGAEIAGTVRDPSGGTIMDAAVVLTSRAQAAPRTAHTGPTGEFRFDKVTPGQYRLTISASGFAESTRNITVRDRPAVPLAVTLRIKNLFQEMTISDRPAGLSIDAGENSDSPQADARQLAGLPAMDNDYLSPLLRFLDPAAIGAGGVSVVVDGIEGPSSRIPRSMIKESASTTIPTRRNFLRRAAAASR